MKRKRILSLVLTGILALGLIGVDKLKLQKKSQKVEKIKQ